jgi:hypothetical protein
MWRVGGNSLTDSAFDRLASAQRRMWFYATTTDYCEAWKRNTDGHLIGSSTPVSLNYSHPQNDSSLEPIPF